MTYIVQRRNRLYVVAYDGVDPLTGKERRRWHPAGTDRSEAEQMARRLDGQPRPANRPISEPVTVGVFLTATWLPRKRLTVRPTTAYRYAWIVHHYVIPAIGDVPLGLLRPEHLDATYGRLLASGGENERALAPKTVHEVHLIIRNALDLAQERELVDRNVARAAHPPKPKALDRPGPRTWTAPQLASFLELAKGHRLYLALHLAALTGMRRGEVAGLKWGDLDTTAHRLSVRRSLQNVGGRPTEFGVKTRTSRRCVDLDQATVTLLGAWRRRLVYEQLPAQDDDWMFCNTKGRSLNPESISQLFDRLVAHSPLPRIRYHDLRHTHASLLVAAGVPVKVVSERLGHAHPGFTMHTYQHLIPGMGAQAAARFADMLNDAARR